MPIYEFYCRDCHTIFNFFSASVNTKKRPLCPKCRRIELDRRMSVFANLKNRGTDDEMSLPDFDESKMEKALGLLEKEMGHVDENDPRQAARLMRKLTDMTGLDMGSGMEEAIHRMEAGEDPEKIEAEMGDLLEGDEPFSLKKKILKAAKSRTPPKVDNTLYDL